MRLALHHDTDGFEAVVIVKVVRGATSANLGHSVRVVGRHI